MLVIGKGKATRETHVLVDEQDSDVLPRGKLLECSFNSGHLSF